MNDRTIIFLLEDTSMLREQLQEALKKNEVLKAGQITVFTCSSIELANESYEAIKDNIACLVCDSNMSSIGLEGLRDISEGGLYSGWLWLREKVKADESLAKRALIYSAYCDELQVVMCENPTFPKIQCIRKKTISSPESAEIIEEIMRIVKER